MNLYARQGDLVFERTDRTAKGDKVTGHVLAGSHEGQHVIAGPATVERVGTGWRVTVAESTPVTHASRHEPITLEPGSYEIRALRERGGNGDQDVED